MAEQSLNPLQAHPIYILADKTASLLGIGRDWIALAETVCLCLGRMSMPVNLEIVSDSPAVDQMLIDRTLSIFPEHSVNIDTYPQFRKEEEKFFKERFALHLRPIGIREKNLAAITAYASRSPDSLEFSPSILCIRNGGGQPSIPGPTLRLMGKLSERKLSAFASSFASTPAKQSLKDELAKLIHCLRPRTTHQIPFRLQFQSSLPPLELMVVERLLQLFVEFRSQSCSSDQIATIDDYEAVRFFLQNLPIVPPDRVISAAAVASAEAIYRSVMANGYQLSLPDLSSLGHKLFTRKSAAEWTGMGYTTAKNHLAELEENGTLLSIRGPRHGIRGRQVYYSFVPEARPPFGWTNPFAQLPKLEASN